MNALTLDFIRRWKWLFLVQLAATTVAWSAHDSGPVGHLHLEVAAAVAMSWDLMRGTIRSQLGLPQRHLEVASGLWLSVVGVAFAVHLAGMLLGAGVIAALRGHPVDPGSLSLHAVLSLVLAGTMQFLLTGLPATPPRTLAGNLKAGVFGLFWGLSIWGGMAVSVVAPESWEKLSRVQAVLMVLLGGLTVASWFTTRQMLTERAMPARQATPVKAAGDLRSLSGGSRGWRARLEQEGRWLVPVMGIVLLAAVIMISINDFSRGGVAVASREWTYQYRTMGMLCVITVFPMVAVAAGSLRAFRGLPLPLSSCAFRVAIRPFLGGLVVFLVYTALNGVLGRSSGMEGRVFAAFLPLFSLMSLAQAVILRYPRFPVMFGILMVISMGSSLLPELMKGALPGPWLALLGVGLLGISWGLHLRWLGKGSQIYRLHQGFLRMVGSGAQR